MTFAVLDRWGPDVVVGEAMAGGAGSNEVRRLRVDGQLAVGRAGRRTDADLAWETSLLVFLDSQGVTVPVPIPTVDGRLFADGVVVMTYVEGRPPETESEWRRVASVLRQVHRATRDWGQRPGWRSSTALLAHETGTRVDLGAMPPRGVARCRQAWSRVAGGVSSVVHGDPHAGNIRITPDRVGLIDWDESRVDVSDLDLALPFDAADLGSDAHDAATQARAAWNAAVCWDVSGADPFAAQQLALVRQVSQVDRRPWE